MCSYLNATIPVRDAALATQGLAFAVEAVGDATAILYRKNGPDPSEDELDTVELHFKKIEQLASEVARYVASAHLRLDAFEREFSAQRVESDAPS